MAVQIQETNGIRLAITGCGHGVLNSIYASIDNACRLKGWDGVDLVIIGGDFQAIRNAYDLNAASMPAKYREMHDFHEYYSGERTAPYLTLFTGGNHEASNYMFELYYGGWVASNIYYLGASGVVRLGALRIAGLSGIWKGYDYKYPHLERLPYSLDDIKSAYHQRELDTRKLLQIRTQVDIGLSHDWPRGIEHYGNKRQLFQFKPHLEPDSQNGTLGSVAANQVMEHLRPRYWFASHLHCKFAALRTWKDQAPVNGGSMEHTSSHPPTTAVGVANEDEIELDVDEADIEPIPSEAVAEKSVAELEHPPQNKPAEVSEELLAQLPESFKQSTRPTRPENPLPPPPPAIRNSTTEFLALDKLEPRKRFLQLQSVTPVESFDVTRPLKLAYDAEWLAISRVFALEGSPLTSPVPPNKGSAHYYEKIDDAQKWIQKNVIEKGLSLQIPQNFERIAPVYDETQGINVSQQPREWPNPQTQAFCDLIGVENPFAISEEEITQRLKNAPTLDPGPGSRNRRPGFEGRGGFGGKGMNGKNSAFRGSRKPWRR